MENFDYVYKLLKRISRAFPYSYDNFNFNKTSTHRSGSRMSIFWKFSVGDFWAFISLSEKSYVIIFSLPRQEHRILMTLEA